MSRTIALKIDVSKIEKERLFKGEKGLYLDAVLFLDEEQDKYGQNGMIVQSVSKEERQNGVRGPILGNCKIIGLPENQVIQPEEPAIDDSIPF